jgi:hypothetical protein
VVCCTITDGSSDAFLVEGSESQGAEQSHSEKALFMQPSIWQTVSMRGIKFVSHFFQLHYLFIDHPCFSTSIVLYYFCFMSAHVMLS